MLSESAPFFSGLTSLSVFAGFCRSVSLSFSSGSSCLRKLPSPPASICPTSGSGLGITCTFTTLPTLAAAAWEASMAAFTAPTSPSTRTVTLPPFTLTMSARETFAAFKALSRASTAATKPYVSIIPNAFMLYLSVKTCSLPFTLWDYLPQILRLLQMRRRLPCRLTGFR